MIVQHFGKPRTTGELMLVHMQHSVLVIITHTTQSSSHIQPTSNVRNVPSRLDALRGILSLQPRTLSSHYQLRVRNRTHTPIRAYFSRLRRYIMRRKTFEVRDSLDSTPTPSRTLLDPTPWCTRYQRDASPRDQRSLDCFHSSCEHPLPLHPCIVTTLTNVKPAIRTMTHLITSRCCCAYHRSKCECLSHRAIGKLRAIC